MSKIMLTLLYVWQKSIPKEKTCHVSFDRHVELVKLLYRKF